MIERSLDFVILAAQRSGSHMLADALNSHQDIRCEGELFREDNVIEPSSGRLTGAILMYSRWKIFGVRFDAPKIIHLTRDPINTARSRLSNSQDKKKGHGRQGAHFFEHTDRTFEINAKRTEEVADSIRAETNRMKSNLVDIPHIEVTYEDLTGEVSITEIEPGISEMLTSFLGANKAMLTTSLVKPNTIYTFQEEEGC